MAEKKFDNDKILSPEQQENFDRYMKEYEEQNGLLMDSYNEDTKIGKISKNKPVMMGLAGLLLVGCIAGLAMSFDKINKQNEQDVKPPVVAQQPAPPTAQPSEQEISQEEKIAKEEAERDLNEIKNNFNPFDGQQDNNLSNQNNSVENQMNLNGVGNNGIYPSNEVIVPEHQYPTPTTSGPDAYHEPATAIPSTSYHPDNHNPAPMGQQPNQMQEALSLKGISVDRYGNRIAYINDGTSTGTFSEGDVVGSFHVISINKNNVVVEDDSGNKVYLNR